MRILQALVTLTIVVAVARAASQSPPGAPPLHPRPARVVAGAASGSATLVPAQFQAGRPGTVELRVTLGTGGLPSGGRLLIGFPKAWFVNPFPIPKRLQPADRTRPHFLAVAASRPGATFAIAIDTTAFSGKV